MMHLVIAQLPDAFLRMVPELATLDLPDETLANCSSCHMLTSNGGCTTSRWHFLEETRCCTFYPSLPNFLVGRALRRDNAGAAALRERMRVGEGVVSFGIAATHERHERQRELEPGEFGRLTELLCPYFVGGTHTCGIWPDRNAVCRTWHCRHVDGPRGRKVWEQLQHLLEILETTLARWCALRGDSPDPGDPVDDWADWYLACADHLEEITDTELKLLRDDRVEEHVAKLLTAATGRGQPMPEVLVPRVVEIHEEGAELVHLTGYWPYDMRLLRRTVFLFLSALDGKRTWRDVSAELEARCGIETTEEDVRDLYNAGLLDVDDAPVEPGTWHMSVKINGDSYSAGGVGEPAEGYGVSVKIKPRPTRQRVGK